MAARVIAQVILQFTAVASRAFVSAYQQALHNAKAGGSGATAATMGKVINKSKMQIDEALKVLNIENSALTGPLLESQYKKFFESNDPKKGGSFYLQSKVFRAKEALDTELNPTIKQEGKADANSSMGNLTQTDSTDSGSSNGNKTSRQSRR